MRSKFRILYKIINSQDQDNLRLKTLNFHTFRDKFMKILLSKLICWPLITKMRLIRNLINSTKYIGQVPKINWRNLMSRISISFKRPIRYMLSLVPRIIRRWTDKPRMQLRSKNKIWVCLILKCQHQAWPNQLKNNQANK